MAGYTSRIFLTLTIPSVFGFLSVLWFLKKRTTSAKQINRAIQVEDSSAPEDTPSDQFFALNPMKLKNKEGSPCEDKVTCSEMQLKETQTSPPPNSNKIESGKVKGKKRKSKLRENGTGCPKDSLTNGKDKHHSVDDKEIELANGVEALNLNKDVLAKDEISLNAINKSRSEMETNGETNSPQASTPSTLANGDAGKNSPQEVENKRSGEDTTAKEQCDTNSSQILCDRKSTVNGSDSAFELSPKVHSNSTDSLTLHADTPECAPDMLASPGSKYCDSEGSNDSGKGGSEFQFLLEAQQMYVVYEFEILQELCGLLIGRNGRHVNYIKQETNANILIKRHPYFPHKKICSIAGTEDEIHAALKLIRKRFPVEIYPTVTLSQVNSLPQELQLPETTKLCLPEGVSFEAMLCATVNAGHFFLQQPTHPTFHSLPALTAQMTSLYSQVETPKLSHLAKGYVCAASLTDGWFRAEVDEVFEDADECRLKFLDYGGYAVLPRESLRQIRFDFMNVPFQATECYLGSVTFLEGETEWSAEATSAFEELAQGQIVQGYIVGYAENRVPYVHLYKITGATSVFINRELVSRGLARWITIPL